MRSSRAVFIKRLNRALIWKLESNIYVFITSRKRFAAAILINLPIILRRAMDFQILNNLSFFLFGLYNAIIRGALNLRG